MAAMLEESQLPNFHVNISLSACQKLSLTPTHRYTVSSEDTLKHPILFETSILAPSGSAASLRASRTVNQVLFHRLCCFCSTPADRTFIAMSTIAPSPIQPLTFSSLPPELRRIIYAEAAQVDVRILEVHWDPWNLFTFHPHPGSLLLVNREAHNASLP
jgi:hypothetical protein